MADISADPYGWSTTEGSNSPAGSVNVGPGLDDNLRAIQAGVKTLRTRLSSVSGTNTITASIANVAAYAAGQQFSFTPASDNSGATTININSLGAKNIFANGVALAGGELRSGIPVVVEYDGTQFNILGLSPAVPLYGGIGKNAIIGGDFSTARWCMTSARRPMRRLLPKQGGSRTIACWWTARRLIPVSLPETFATSGSSSRATTSFR
jgi:hypothetical protein